MAEQSFADFGIDIPSGRTSGTVYSKCPECSASRKAKNRNAKPLAVDIDKGIWICNNCGWKGSLHQNGQSHKPQDYTPPPKAAQQFLPEPTWNWIFPDTTIDPVPSDPLRPTGKHTVTFYMRNLDGKLTSAKRMLYDFSTGQMRRDHESMPFFPHTRDSGYYPCLFLEHHLAKFPQATVILVESEKTAAMLTRKFKEYLSEYIYIASGGAKGLTEDKLDALAGRTILICYDCDNGIVLEDGSVKNPKGREGAESALEKLKPIANAKVVDIDPDRTDGTDLADLIREIDIQYIRGLSRRVPPQLEAIWKNILLTQKPPYREPILTIDGKRVFTPGNHSMILGKMKSRKTLFLTWLVKEATEQKRVDPSQIMFFDTEQADEDVWEVREKLLKLTGATVNVFMLRGCSHKERLQIIDQTIDLWPHARPRWVIIDGIRDLMANINDVDESNDIITWLQKRTYRQDLHITEILHMNKGNDNARGHIGTELLNRTEVTIELELDQDPTYTNVKCAYSRRQTFEPFMICHGPAPDFLPEIVGMKVGDKPVTVETEREKCIRIFNDSKNGMLKYRDLLNDVIDSFEVSERKARIIVKRFQERDWVMRNGKPRSPETVYKLMISNDPNFVPAETPESQTHLFNGNGAHEPAPVEEKDDDLPF